MMEYMASFWPEKIPQPVLDPPLLSDPLYAKVFMF